MKNISKKSNESPEEKKTERQEGITLVALVITIIIIIILATVTIRFAFGDDGIIKRAELASDMYANDTAYTDQSMANVVGYLDGMLNGVTGGSGNPDEPDTTPPSISLQTSSTENTITVTVTAIDESGLAESETYEYYLNNVQQGEAITENTKTYTGLQASTEYTIKVVVKDKFGNAAEETAQVRTTDPAVPDMGDAKPNPDQDGPEYSTTTTIQDDLGNSVVIPGGFHLDKDSGTKVEEGIIIEDANGNQFVWIPTGTYNVTESVDNDGTKDGKLTNNLARRIFTSSGSTEITASNGDGVIENYYYGEGDSRSVAYSQIAAFKASANPKSETNLNGRGGFYIGRYEQGTGNVCKAGVAPYTSIMRHIAKSQAEAMYSGKNNNVVSQLISSYAWDTALNFICQTNSEGYILATTTSSSYGNIGTDSKQNTGIYSQDNYSNIHDLLGNCSEWTTEYSGNIGQICVTRGGYCYYKWDYAARRYMMTDAVLGESISFRIQLYVK